MWQLSDNEFVDLSDILPHLRLIVGDIVPDDYLRTVIINTIEDFADRTNVLVSKLISIDIPSISDDIEIPIAFAEQNYEKVIRIDAIHQDNIHFNKLSQTLTIPKGIVVNIDNIKLITSPLKDACHIRKNIIEFYLDVILLKAKSLLYMDDKSDYYNASMSNNMLMQYHTRSSAYAVSNLLKNKLGPSRMTIRRIL